MDLGLKELLAQAHLAQLLQVVQLGSQQRAVAKELLWLFLQEEPLLLRQILE